MMITTRSKLASWLDALAARVTVVAPRAVDSVVLYRPIGSSDEILFDFQRSAMSPKAAVLPSTEVLLDIQSKAHETRVNEPPFHVEQVLFAVRPCDARAFRALDALLVEHEPADYYYGRRRSNTTLVGLACPNLWADCFCTSVGGAPDDGSDVDIMMYQDGQEYLVEAITERGQALLAGVNGSPPLEGEETQRQAPASDLTGPDVPLVESGEWPRLFDEDFWQRFTERCLSCHACTYVCPTCRCFDIRDYTIAAGASGAHIERIRSWDSCMASAYRRIAGGHNPRPSRTHRLRNRYYCKFHYCVEDFGVVACVGCGRCIEVCPVGVDISEMLQGLSEVAAAVSPEGEVNE